MLAGSQSRPNEGVIGLSTFRNFVAEGNTFEAISMVMIVEYYQSEFAQIGRLATFIPNPLCDALEWAAPNLKQLIIELRSAGVERDKLKCAHNLCPAAQKFCSGLRLVGQDRGISF